MFVQHDVQSLATLIIAMSAREFVLLKNAFHH